jgi:hypothetical protein
MPPVISFNHSHVYVSTGLAPAAGFQVGVATSITISLTNTGSDAGNANVLLWWVGPCASSTTGPMIDLVNGHRLAPPFNAAPIKFTVSAGTGGHVTVSWTPNAADFPPVLGPSIPGSLFAQVAVLASPPIFSGDNTALNNWNPTHPLCAQRNIQIAT